MSETKQALERLAHAIRNYRFDGDGEGGAVCDALQEADRVLLEQPSKKTEVANELKCTKCGVGIVIGDYFTHKRSGADIVCTGVRRSLVEGKIVTVFELSVDE